MFIVVELQKINDDTVANIVNAYANKSVAEQKYHSALAAAAVSTIPVNTVVMLNERGEVLKREFYVHEVMTNE